MLKLKRKETLCLNEMPRRASLCFPVSGIEKKKITLSIHISIILNWGKMAHMMECCICVSLFYF